MITQLGLGLVQKMPPETAHQATIAALKSGLGVPVRAVKDEPSLAVKLPVSGLNLSNPVGLAAGFDKNADVFGPMLKFGFGFVECGTVTPLPQPGNPRPRLFRLPAERAVINRMGFNNHGLGYFVRRLERRGERKGLVGANVGANKTSEDRIGDYVAGMKAVWAHADYLTLNISSPNTPGLRGLQDKSALDELLKRCGGAATTLDHDFGRKPVFLKVAPDLTEEAVADIVTAVLCAPYLHGLIVSNTTIERPAGVTSAVRHEPGGLSGAPLMDASTRVLRLFAKALDGKLDLIGAGGISSGADAYEKIKAGAHAVQLYSALIYEGPALVARIKAELDDALTRDGFKTMSEAVGSGL